MSNSIENGSSIDRRIKRLKIASFAGVGLVAAGFSLGTLSLIEQENERLAANKRIIAEGYMVNSSDAYTRSKGLINLSQECRKITPESVSEAERIVREYDEHRAENDKTYSSTKTETMLQSGLAAVYIGVPITIFALSDLQRNLKEKRRIRERNLREKNKAE